MPVRSAIAQGMISVLPKGAQRWIHCTRHLYHGRGTELAVLPQLCDPNRISVDIGANTGVHSLVMQRYSRGVVAFEPNPKLIRELLELFADSTVRVESVALGQADGTAVLTVPTFGQYELHGWARLRGDLTQLEWRGRRYSGAERFEVPVRRLDDYALADVGFIKIDVEGYEEEVLAGAEQTISRHRPVLMIEIESRHSSDATHIERVVSSVCSIGYTAHFVRGGHLQPFSSFDVATMQSPDLADVSPHYVNNFVFLPIDPASPGEPRGSAGDPDADAQAR